MTNPNRFRGKIPILAVAWTLAAVSVPQAAHARDKEFGMLVHHIEAHYHVHRQYRFLIGLASFAVNIVRPYGVKGMKLALWENEKITANKNDLDFSGVVKAGLAEGWQPMVRVWSRRDGERTVIFAKPEGKEMKLLVATIEEDEAVVVQVKINPDKLSRYIDEWSHDDRHDRDGDKYFPKPAAPDHEVPEPTQIADGM